jgi:hypothetical protein
MMLQSDEPRANHRPPVAPVQHALGRRDIINPATDGSEASTKRTDQEKKMNGLMNLSVSFWQLVA